MNSSRRASGGETRGPEAFEVHAVGQRHRGCPGDGTPVFLGHRHHPVHLSPRRRLKVAPQRHLASQHPAFLDPEQLLIEIEGNVVLHQNGARRRARVRILRELSEFQLRDRRAPLADGLLQRRAKGVGIELLNYLRTSRERQRVAPGAPHQNYLRAKRQHLRGRRGILLRERHQHQVELLRGAAHQVVHAHRTAMRKRKRQVRAGHQHARSAGGAPSRKDAHTAIGERQKELFPIRRRRRRPALPRDCRRRVERSRRMARAQEQAAQRMPPESLKQAGVADRARQKAQVIHFQNPAELRLAEKSRCRCAMPVLHHRAARIYAGPASLPRAISQVEIFHVGRFVHFVYPAQRMQFRSVV